MNDAGLIIPKINELNKELDKKIDFISNPNFLAKDLKISSDPIISMFKSAI